MISRPVVSEDSSASMASSHADFTAADLEEITAIAVMGVTGSGKSNFIKHATSSERVRVGHNMQSCTENVEQYELLLEGHQILLFDTPGFDDTNRLDADILAELAETFSTLYKKKLKLAGIIYVHKITDNRMTNTLLRNLSVIRNLCGDEPLKNVTILTTFWDTVDIKVAKQRESEMIEKHEWWGYMVSKGSKVRRFWNTEESAHNIINEFVEKERLALQIQREMVDQGLDVKHTQAGAALNLELAQLSEKHQREMLALEEKMKKAIRDGKVQMQEILEIERREKEKELTRMQREQLALERDRSEDARRMEQAFQDQLLRLVEDRKEREAQLKALEEQLTRERTDSDRRLQEALERAESNLQRITANFAQARAEDRERYNAELEAYKVERADAIKAYKAELQLANAELVTMYEEKQIASESEKHRLEGEISKLKTRKKKSKAALWAKIGGATLCAVLAPFTGGISALFIPAFSAFDSGDGDSAGVEDSGY